MGVVPIVNENDTISVSVSVSILAGFWILLKRTMSGNKIWRQRHIVGYYVGYGSRRLFVFAHGCRWALHDKSS
jgi:hypothetical protein